MEVSLYPQCRLHPRLTRDSKYRRPDSSPSRGMTVAGQFRDLTGFAGFKYPSVVMGTTDPSGMTDRLERRDCGLVDVPSIHHTTSSDEVHTAYQSFGESPIVISAAVVHIKHRITTS